MAHRKAKEKAFQLFAEGLYPPDVSGMLNIGIRSCQRWYKDFLGEGKNVTTSRAENSEEIVATSLGENSEKIATANLVENSEKQSRTLDNKNWLDFAQNLSNDHFFTHNEIRTKIQKILNQKLDEPDLNLRSIHTLSLSLSRHLEGERVAASLEFLDVNRAALRVEATGLTIFDPSAITNQDEQE